MKKIIKFFLIIIIISFTYLNLISIEKLPDLMNSQWMVIGPFDNPEINGACKNFDNDFLISIGGENNLNPQTKKDINGLKWKYYKSNSEILNFLKIFGEKNYSIAYAYQEFNIKSDQKAVLKFGSDDGIKVWLNGNQIINHHIHRPININDELVIVDLKAGKNKILIKIDQGTGEWGFTLKLKTFEEEIAGFNKTKINGLNININKNIILDNNISGNVLTNPSYYINEKIKVVLYDINNKILKEINVKVGQNFNFRLKNPESNLYFLKSYGYGKLSKLQSDQEIVIIGDYNKIINKYIKIARAISIQNKFPECNFDIPSTCLFLKNQLEGKMHSSLTTPDRNLRAIYTINKIHKYIQNPNFKFTGINQRAYYSSLDGSYQPYTIYVPSSYNKNKKYKLLVCLHGFSGNEYDAVKNVATCEPEDFIIVGAFGRGDVGYYGIGEQDVLDVIDLIKKNYNIDNDRVYIVGWSMGGVGTWRFGQLYADKFAAIAPFCGWTWKDHLDNLINLPVLIVHGAKDTVVPIDMDIKAAEYLKSIGYNVRFDELPEAGHNIWDPWIKDSDPNKLLNYFRNFKRNHYPKNINIFSQYIRYGKQYWGKIIEFINPTKPGLLKAKIIDDRHIKISTENIKLFELNLDHPELAKKGRIIININQYNVLTDAGKSKVVFEFSDKKNRFDTIKNYIDPIVPHKGGGLVDLFMKKLYIVYGTKKQKNIKKWKNFAEIMSNFQVNEKISFGTKVGKYKVISDKELLKLIESQNTKIKDYNILLLGSYKENQVIEKISKDLPLKFHGDSIEIQNKKYKKSGIIFTYPNPIYQNNLISIISLPYKSKKITEYAINLNINLRMYVLSRDVSGFLLPDLTILKSIEKVSAIGFYNYNWKELNILNIN
jgi:pimeloyl-ACP methyl ester carboxylesterase